MSPKPRLTAARLTAGGRGAVATIRVCGELGVGEVSAMPQSHFLFKDLFRSASGLSLIELPLHKIAFGRWGTSNEEELVVCRTGKNILEIHCHGGDAAVQRILNDLQQAGCEIVDWQEQVRVTTNVLDAECLEVLSRTSTWRTSRIALEQSNGLLKQAFLNLKTLATSEDVRLQQSVDDLLRWTEFGLHLSRPWSVVLTGRPNVGKSSLINALLGYQRAIVFDEPGTTRDVVTGETAFDGWPVALSDTAGIRDQAGGLEAAGILLARDRLRTADLQLLVLDLGEPVAEDDLKLLRDWPDALVVAHKSDRLDCWQKERPANSILVSSVRGDGLNELQQRIVARLVPKVPEPGTPIPVTERQLGLLKRIRDSGSKRTREQAVLELLESSPVSP